MLGNGSTGNTRVIILLALAVGSSGVLYTFTDGTPQSRWYATSLSFSVPIGADEPFFVQLNHDQRTSYLSTNGAFVGGIANPSPTIWLKFTDFASFTVSLSGPGTAKLWLTDKDGNAVPNEARCSWARLFCDPKVPTILTLAQQRVESDYYTEATDGSPVILHVMNVGSAQLSGGLVLGVSTVVDSKPGFFIGLAILGIGILYLLPEVDKYARTGINGRLQHSMRPD